MLLVLKKTELFNLFKNSVFIFLHRRASTHLYLFKIFTVLPPDTLSQNVHLLHHCFYFWAQTKVCQELQHMVGGYKSEPLSDIVFIKPSLFAWKASSQAGEDQTRYSLKQIISGPGIKWDQTDIELVRWKVLKPWTHQTDTQIKI